MAISLDYSAWLLEGDEVKRRFIYRNPQTGTEIAVLYFDWLVLQGTFEVQTHMSFMLRPFSVVDGLDLSLSLSPLRSPTSTPVLVKVTSVDDGALMAPMNREGVHRLLSPFLLGKELSFRIFQGEEQLVELPLFNDGEFPRLHQERVKKFTPKKGWFWQR